MPTFNPPGVGPRPLHFPIPGRWLEYRTNDPIPPSADPDDGLNLAGFTGADMRELQRRNIIRPRWLSFYNSSGIGHSDLQVLRGFSDLRGIDQNFCGMVGDAGIREVSALENLEYLNLQACRPVSDVGCAYLANLTKLRWLEISWVYRITNEGLGSLARLPQLEELFSDDQTDVGDAGFECLGSVLRLRNLQVWMVRATDVGLRHLGDNARELRQLDFFRLLAATDRGLLDLLRCRNLADLSFGGCPLITRAGVRALAEFKNLRRLMIYHAESVTREGVEWLHSRLSDCDQRVLEKGVSA